MISKQLWLKVMNSRLDVLHRLVNLVIHTDSYRCAEQAVLLASVAVYVPTSGY